MEDNASLSFLESEKGSGYGAKGLGDSLCRFAFEGIWEKRVGEEHSTYWDHRARALALY